MTSTGILEAADQLDSRQFMIAIRKLADSLSYGTDRSPFLGSGIEFAQSRQYQYGDPIKTIDWRVTARTGKVFIKEYEAPKRLPCYLMIDTSASMMIGTHHRTKYATAIHIAGGLGLACLDRISPVGIVGVGERDIRSTPTLSKLDVMQWLHRLRHFRYNETTLLGQRIAELGSTLLNRALIIVMSDLHDPAALPALKRLAQLHDVVAIQMRDPAEVKIAGAGIYRATEAETGRSFVTHGRRQAIDQEHLTQSLRKSGIDHLLVETDRPFAHQLRNFFESRDLLGRGAR